MSNTISGILVQNLYDALQNDNCGKLFLRGRPVLCVFVFFSNFKFITTLVVGSYGFGIGGGFMSYGSRGFFPRGPQRNMVSGSKNYILSVNV